MSKFNSTIYKQLISAESFNDLANIVNNDELVSPDAGDLFVQIESQTDVLAFKKAVKAICLCLGIKLNFPTNQNRNKRPSCVVLITEELKSCRQLYGFKFASQNEDGRKQLMDESISAIIDCIQKLRTTNPDSTILVLTLPSPLIHPSGIQDLQNIHGLESHLLQINLQLIQMAPNLTKDNVFVVGYHQYSTTLTRSLFDEDLWSNIPLSEHPGLLPRLLEPAWALSHWLYPLVFQRSKAIALDLDDTLWRGTYSEDGIESLEMSLDKTFGYSHHKLQTFFSSLKQQGIMVGFVTRNLPQISETVNELTDRGLLITQPSIIKADMYKSKAELIKGMCEHLDNIHPSTVVFVDNSDIERELVYNSGLGCTVAPFPSDIRLFEKMLLHLPFLEKLYINDADRERNRWYDEIQSKKLEFNVEVLLDPMEPTIIDRVVELIHKTNQFNLTTKRYSYEQVVDFINTPDTHIFAFRTQVSGDYESNIKPSVFGVAITTPNAHQEWTLDVVLMSCRYMALGLDYRMLRLVAEKAVNSNIHTLVGMYAPSDRNSLVKQWYQKMNFMYLHTKDGVEYFRIGAKELLKKEGQPNTSLSLLDLESYLNQHIVLQNYPNDKNIVRQRNIDNAVEVFIPTGDVVLGITSEEADFIQNVFGIYPSAEIDLGIVSVENFWIDKHCVTNLQYCQFMNSFFEPTRRSIELEKILDKQPRNCLLFNREKQTVYCSPEFEHLPVILPVEYASMYANWAGGRLPTEGEWTRAVRGNDTRWFPWGNSLPTSETVWSKTNLPSPVNFSLKGASPFGLIGTLGNVWQWCSTNFNGHPQYKGGHYELDSIYWKRVTLRPIESAEHCGNLVGFRVVRDGFITP